jgi:flagellar hook assembly protein FlgD
MLKIYNITGQLVETLVDENQQAGYYSVKWDGKNSASGLYYCRIIAGEFTQSKKMILLK